jgi:hypothetical protein
LLGIVLTFDGLYLLVPIFFYNIFMDRTNETINHDIVYSTCNVWLRCNAMLIFASDKMKHFKVYQWLIGHYICGLWSLKTYLELWTDDIGHTFLRVGHNNWTTIVRKDMDVNAPKSLFNFQLSSSTQLKVKRHRLYFCLISHNHSMVINN